MNEISDDLTRQMEQDALMRQLRRRRFLETAAWGSVAGLAQPVSAIAGPGNEHRAPALQRGGVDFSPRMLKQRTGIPSACWQCVTRCAIIGFVENSALVKIEGNPRMRSSAGYLCARGQAGVNQLYHPDRLLYPLKRAGKRGEGKWQRISWAAALDLLIEGGEVMGRPVRGLRVLRDEGTPERFLFHYGRMTGSDWVINMMYFLPAFGTGSVGDHNSICVAAGGVGSSLTGDARPSHGFDDAQIILNFGASFLEGSLNHIPDARRCVEALARGAKLYTFDVRLSNTAAKSSEWIPVQPGTDLAVILAMCRILLQDGLYDDAFLRDHTNVSAAELTAYLKEYTPEWAEGKSGVPAAKLVAIAHEFARTKPGMCLGLRGLFMHHNGVQSQRALHLLRVLSGNVGTTGKRASRPQWDYPFPMPETEPRSLPIFEGEDGAFPLPYYKVSHQILHMIDIGPERPEIYLNYCHNPVYSNGDCNDNVRILKDEEKIPFLVCSDVTLSETSVLADLVLPDATYLERWTCEGTTAPDGTPEYYIRQPLVPLPGEARNFCNVVCDIAARLGIDLGFKSAEEFVRETCDNTPGVKEAGGFAYMKEHGIWHDDTAETAVYDRPPDAVTIKSAELAKHGFAAIPLWMPIPEHEAMSDDELILTTFKVSTQTHSRTQNCKWLTELFHTNPAWINPQTAMARGIADGDRIISRSAIGELVTRARVTEGIHPRTVAVANHAGHWEYGWYASGQDSHGHVHETDCDNKWWREGGAHVNTIIPNKGDPIAGSLCWMDTVVRVEKD
jgi:anaerobic selenocysteine-containing dehydrogenase